MNESLFIEYVSKIWPKLSLYVNEKINGKKTQPTYLHKTMLTPVYSADQKWEGTSANTVYVAADMVAMDSPLPLKSRNAISTASGTLPKVGMKKQLRETEINAINIMKAHLSLATGEAAGSQKARIFNKILDDGLACSIGIDERNEANFLAALSDGVILIEDEKNTGIGLRVNFGYLTENAFGVATEGTITGDDIQRVLDKANNDGNTVAAIAIAKSTYDKIRKTQWAKELVAGYKEMTVTSDTTLPVPNAATFDAAFESEYGVSFLKIDRSVSYEKNGKRTSYKPFNANKLVFLPDASNVGSLVWGTLAEDTNRVNGVEYSTVDQYKLISRYSKNDPLAEFTNGQALVLPVIENVEQIYTIDLTNAQPINEASLVNDEDELITVWGNNYNKPKFIEAMVAMGVSVRANATDATVVKKVNELSDADEAKLQAAVESFKA